MKPLLKAIRKGTVHQGAGPHHRRRLHREHSARPAEGHAWRRSTSTQVPFLPVFCWLQEIGGVAEREMLRTFNCGIGMIVVVAGQGRQEGCSLASRRAGETVVTLGTHPQAQGQGGTGGATGAPWSEMKRKRVGVLISGRGSNMVALVEAAREPAYPAEIVCVVSNRADAEGLAFAARHGIARQVIDHKEYRHARGLRGSTQRLSAAPEAGPHCLRRFHARC